MLKKHALFLASNASTVIAPGYLLAAALYWFLPERWEVAASVLALAVVDSGLAIWGWTLRRKG